jgi:hypothetical protein
MSSVRKLHMFTVTLDKFFVYLKDNFKDLEKDVLVIENIVYLLKTSNPQIMIDQYSEYVGQYSKYIDECNDNFFYNMSEDNFTTSFTLQLFLKIKQLWVAETMGEKQKATIWFYIKNLLKICQGD